MKIYVINGRPRAGKDTFVEYCKKHCTWCLNISTVDFVKRIATQCGWDGTKTPRNRAFLSSLKDLLTDWDDVPFKKITDAIKCFEAEIKLYDFETDNAVVFIHCREPMEIERFRRELGAKAVLLTREAVESEETSNHADADVFNFNYDYTITNNGSLSDLEKTAVNFLDSIGIKNLK